LRSPEKFTAQTTNGYKQLTDLLGWTGYLRAESSFSMGSLLWFWGVECLSQSVIEWVHINGAVISNAFHCTPKTAGNTHTSQVYVV